MPTSGPFSGSSLFLESVVAVNTTTIKAQFSQDPLAVSASGANDALNPANYSLSGPGAVTITLSAAASGDPQSFYLTTSSPLVNGTWTLTTANIKTAAANPLIDPKSKIFVTTSLLSRVSVANGATNSTAEDVLRKHLSPALKGKNWDAVISALASGDTYLSQLGQSLFQQLFKSTASGKYLDRKASEEGIIRNALSDELFRQLLIKTGSDKVTAKALAQVLEIYYGADSVRAHIDSIDGNFDIQSGDTLIIEIDNKTVTVQFVSDDFQTVGSATAVEVSAIINKALNDAGLQAFALSINNNYTSKTFVRIYSGALGLRGYVRVWGGSAQNSLQFSSLVPTTQAATTQWQILKTTANVVRITWTGVGTNPSLVLIRPDDYINVFGSPFSAANRGTFKIINVSTSYFEIENATATNETIAQVAADDILFFRSNRKTLNDIDRPAFEVQTQPDVSEVFLPVTTQSIVMQPKSAAYLHAADPISTFRNKLVCTSLTRAAGEVTVVTPSAHNLLLNDTFYLAPGSPNIGQDFIPGVKTVTDWVDATTFKYAEAGAAVVATGTHYIYYCYRDSAGTITLQTSAAHGLSTGQLVLMDNLMPDNNVAPSPYFIDADPTSSIPAINQQTDYAAVKMADGKILICGGQTAGVYTAKAAIFNPATLLWAAAGDMNAARARHSLLLLSNGRILCTGGYDGADMATCEVYDPTLDIWLALPDMTNARSYHSSIILDDGRVMVAGGSSSTVEFLDVTTSVWTNGAAALLTYGGTGLGSLTKFSDGRVLLTGSDTNAFAEIYNPFLDYWTQTGANQGTRVNHATFLVRQGTSDLVYTIAGWDSLGGVPSDNIEAYDPNTNTWSLKLGLLSTQYRDLAIAARATDGRIVLVGGATNPTTADIYDPLDNSLTSLSATVPSRDLGFGFLLDDDRLLFTHSTVAAYENPLVFYPSVFIKKAGGINGTLKVTNVSSQKLTATTTTSSTFTQETPFVTSYTDKSGNALTTKAYPFKAVADANNNGPYLIDKYSSIAITGTATTTTVAIVKGASYPTVTVADTTDFPESGYLVFAFGRSNQVYPVKYLYKVSSTVLAIENSFVFNQDLPVATTVALLKQTNSWVPESPETIGAFYLTDSIIGRINAGNVITDIQGAGLTVNQTIVYPGSIGLGNSQNQPNTTGVKVNDIVYIYGNQEDVDKYRE